LQKHVAEQVKEVEVKLLAWDRADETSRRLQSVPGLGPIRATARTRCGIAEWLVKRLAKDAPTLVGIDHGFSFPIRYFDEYGLKHDWPTFLDDFQRYWPTEEDNTIVESMRAAA
jgi:hypothetical protein